MTTPFIGVVVSSGILSLLVLLFSIEDRRGTRFLERIRMRADRTVLLCNALWNRFTSYLERDLMRQSLHYFLHTILTTLLSFLRASEVWVKVWLRSNKSYARKAREERAQRSIFDEIADHKVATALTPKERKKVKETSIGGKL